MKHRTKWAVHLALPWLLALLVLVLQPPTVYAVDSDTQPAIDMNGFSLEIKAEGVEYTVSDAAQSYTLQMDGEEGGYLYGFYRQGLDWSQQAGVCITIANDSEAELRLVLQLMDADWQSIEIPDDTPVFLQETGESEVSVVFASDGAVAVPAGFAGQVQVPLIADDDILSSLEGLGFTFVPAGEATCTLYGITFWGEATALQYQSHGTLGIALRDTSLTIPQTGYSMTTVALQGVLDTQCVTYTVINAPAGVWADEAGRVWVDATASTGTVMVRAVVEGQYLLQTTLTLTSVWDIKPEEVALDTFAILDPPGNAQPPYVQVFLWWTERLPLLRAVCILLGLILPCIYLRWRIDAKE